LGLELVKIILFTIPYIMTSSAAENEFQASALLEKTDIIASTPHPLVALVDPFVTDEEKPEPIQSVVSLLQTQLQDEASKGWELVCIPRPWKTPREDENDGTDPFDSMTKHPFPEVTIPNPVKSGPKAILPDIYLSVYSGQEIETVPPPTTVTSLILRDALIDTINILDFNRVATAKFLIDIDCYFAPDIFVKRATPFDKLREIPSGRSTWKPEDVAVDAVFSQLFQLPAPEHKLVYYHSVLTECCKVAPAAIAPSLGRAIRFLYRNVKVLDLDLSHRFLDWFSHHLSNFGFTWKWTEWWVVASFSLYRGLRNVLIYVQYRIEDLELPVIHPKMSFITGALDKEIRLSFAQRIKGTLPDPYQALILEGKEKDTPDFKFASDCAFTTPSLAVLLLFTDLPQQHPTRRKVGKSCSSSARRLRTKISSPSSRPLRNRREC
jgi:nuclear cap-binding protein subunit 1